MGVGHPRAGGEDQSLCGFMWAPSPVFIHTRSKDSPGARSLQVQIGTTHTNGCNLGAGTQGVFVQVRWCCHSHGPSVGPLLPYGPEKTPTVNPNSEVPGGKRG